MSDLKDNLLLEEFKQAWEHYRHVENSRLSVVGFLFTVVLASGACISLLFNGSHPSSEAYFLTLVVAFLVGVLAVVIYARLAKQSLVLRHYAQVWKFLRQVAYGQEYSKLSSHISIYENPAVQRFYFTEERITKWMSIAVAFIFALYLMLGFLSIWPNFNLDCWQRVTVFILFINLLSLAFYILVKDYHAKVGKATYW